MATIKHWTRKFFLVCMWSALVLIQSADASTVSGVRGGGGFDRDLEGNNATTPAKQPRIINGDKVKDNRYAYFSLMLSQFMCGAVLIGPRLVLGAAHCAGGSADFRIGAQDDVNSGERIRIQHAVIHPGFDISSFEYDVALFYLAEPTQQPFIQADSTEITQKGTKLTVIGFGDTIAGNGMELSEELLEAELEYVENKECDKMHGGFDEVSDDMLCAAGKDTDSCGGDSGGPLVLKGNSIAEDRLVSRIWSPSRKTTWIL
ncbi:MAG: hypothetical protein SGILL_010029 [Bacillariaceae sp.]